MQFKTIQQTFFFGILISISLLFLWMIKDFLYVIFWAIILGMFFHPLRKKILHYIPRFPQIASLATLTICIITFFAFSSIVGSMIVKESVLYYQSFVGANQNTDSINIIDRFEVITQYLSQYNIPISQERIEGAAISIVQYITSWTTSQLIVLGQHSFRVIINLFILLYVVFFILNDGIHVRDRILKILPLGAIREKKLIQKFTSTTRATLKGTFLVAIIQGIAGGLLFWATGISAPFIWGLFMTILSIIPAVGPVFIWLPAGIILLLTGNIVQGSIVLIGGGLISFSENILRPLLVGKDAEMPGFLILLSTFGGISLFGITGFIIGPIVTAFLIAIWHMFEEDNKENLETLG